MNDNNKNISEILKKSLKIVDKLARIDIDTFRNNEDLLNTIELLIKEAQLLKNNKFWKI